MHEIVIEVQRLLHKYREADNYNRKIKLVLFQTYTFIKICLKNTVEYQRLKLEQAIMIL